MQKLLSWASWSLLTAGGRALPQDWVKGRGGGGGPYLWLYKVGRYVNYGTRTANNYWSHPCHTNLKQCNILYQGLKIWNSLPASITCSSSLPSFKKKNIYLEFLIKQLWFGLAAHAALLFLNDLCFSWSKMDPVCPGYHAWVTLSPRPLFQRRTLGLTPFF